MESPPRLPPEILDRIVQLALATFRSKNDRDFNRLAPIASFSLASRTFRLIAIRRFLEHMLLEGQGKLFWTLLDSLEASGTGGYTSVKALRTNSRTLSFNYMRLDSLTRLQSFSVDMDNEGLSTQHLLMKKFLKYLYRPTTGSLYFALTALKLTSLARIDVPLLRLISKNTPALVHLHVSCTERLWYECCWNCYTDNAECFIHSPIPDMFIDADDLARQFSLALKPLTKLTHLHMGIFLTQESYLYEHVAHARYEQSYPPDECDVCTKTTLQTPFIDSDLSDDHPQNNALDTLDPAAEMEAIELRASLIFAKNIRSLTRISWSSWLGQRSSVDWKGEEEPTVDTRGAPNTTIWIRRHAGRVRLRSAPW